MTREKTDMAMGHFKYLVSQGHDLGVELVSVFGHGEPLLDKEIAGKINYCSEHGFNTFITTNGSLLSPDMAVELVEAGLGHIRFSAHGMRENYEAVHRGLNWNRFIENVGTFNRIRRELDSNCLVSVSVIPMHGETIDEIRNFWEPNSDYLEIWKPHNWTTGRNFRLLKVIKRKPTCGRPESGPVQILADGRMIACCFDFDGQLLMGNTHKDTIEEILTGDRFDTLRWRHRYNKHEGTLCEKCDQLNIETESPLLYSNRDAKMEAGRLSTTKIKLKEM